MFKKKQTEKNPKTQQQHPAYLQTELIIPLQRFNDMIVPCFMQERSSKVSISKLQIADFTIPNSAPGDSLYINQQKGKTRLILKQTCSSV